MRLNLFLKVSLFALIAILLIAKPSLAGTTEKEITSDKNFNVYIGKVNRLNEQTLQINRENSTYEYDIAKNVPVFHNGGKVSFSDLKLDSPIKIWVNEEFKVIQIAILDSLEVKNAEGKNDGPQKSYDVLIDGKRLGDIADFNDFGSLSLKQEIRSHVEIDLSASGKASVKESNSTGQITTSWMIEKPGRIGLIVQADSQEAMPKWITEWRGSKEQRFVSIVGYLNGYLAGACTFVLASPCDLVLIAPGTSLKIGDLMIQGGHAQLTLDYDHGQCAIFPAGMFVGSFK